MCQLSFKFLFKQVIFEGFALHLAVKEIEETAQEDVQSSVLLQELTSLKCWPANLE